MVVVGEHRLQSRPLADGQQRESAALGPAHAVERVAGAPTGPAGELSDALAVSRWIEHQTGWSIKKFVRTARQYRTVQVNATTAPSK